jgi:hypothetical protein
VRDTVNDALPFPAPNKSHGSYHWAFERLLSAALVPATVAAFVVSPSAYPILDGILGVSLVMHSHIGVSSWSQLWLCGRACFLCDGRVSGECFQPCWSGRVEVDKDANYFLFPQFDNCVVDYLHPRKFPKLGPAITWALRGTTAAVLVGVYQFNTNDIGAEFYTFFSFWLATLPFIHSLLHFPASSPPFLAFLPLCFAFSRGAYDNICSPSTAF